MPDRTAKSPRIEAFELGPFGTNCYLVTVPDCRSCWIVDAGFDIQPLIDAVRDRDLAPAALLLTHAHPDHIAGVRAVREAWPEVPIHIHPAEAEWLVDPELNLSVAMGMPVTTPRATDQFDDGDDLELEGTRWKVMHTPGHSPGGVSLYCADAGAVIAGDALFAGSIGRTDFPGSSFDELARSIRTKLYMLPAETVVYPGHGPTTTVGREMASNPFVPA